MNKGLQILILTIATLTGISCGGAKHTATKKPAGVWQATPITVDGNNKDWPSPYPEYDEKAQLGYAVSNDKDNLYITVETGDLATQLKILRNGLTVWIDKTGEKNLLTAINYPIPQDAAEQKIENKGWQQCKYEDRQRMELEDRVRVAKLLATDYSLQGFKSCNLQYPLTEKDSCGVHVRLDIDADNELVWEAVVPFRSFYPKREIDKRDKGKPISICIETVGMKRPVGQQAGQSHSHGTAIRPGIGFGMAGMGVGMSTGGGRGGRSSTQAPVNIMEPMYKSSVTWKRFGIAAE